MGIDLGTTNSLIAVLVDGEPVVITTTEGSRLLLLVVSFTQTGGRLAGQIAKRQLVINSENTVSSIKYSGAVATEPGDSERPSDHGRPEPHVEDVMEGEDSEM